MKSLLLLARFRRWCHLMRHFLNGNHLGVNYYAVGSITADVIKCTCGRVFADSGRWRS